MKHYQKMNRCSELILAPWERSVTQCDGAVTSVGGEAALRRGNGGNDVS
jgi:hypothetical protein